MLKLRSYRHCQSGLEMSCWTQHRKSPVTRGLDPDQVGEAPNRELLLIVALLRRLVQPGGVFVVPIPTGSGINIKFSGEKSMPDLSV
jgi:hypothetical protein